MAQVANVVVLVRRMHNACCYYHCADDSETDMMEAMGLSGVMGNEDDNETSYSDVEGSAEDESAHEEDVRGAWGRRAANYYEEGTGVVMFGCVVLAVSVFCSGIEQNDEESDDNSDIELQEEEAEKLHKDALKSLLPAHCLLDESLALSCPEKVLEQPMDFEKVINEKSISSSCDRASFVLGN